MHLLCFLPFTLCYPVATRLAFVRVIREWKCMRDECFLNLSALGADDSLNVAVELVEDVSDELVLNPSRFFCG